MTMKQKLQYTLDALMSISLILLMSYQLIGKSLHEYLGVSMFLMFILHQIFNWRWYKNLFHGSYNSIRLLSTLINILIFLIMIVMMISGMLMSKYVFSTTSFDGSSWARLLHLWLSYWGLFLMSMHLGLHWNRIYNVFKKHIPYKQNRKGIKLAKAFHLLILSYGIYALYKRQLLDYMFMKNQYAFFDFNEPILYFLFDYFMVFVLFLCVGHYISIILRKRAITNVNL